MDTRIVLISIAIFLVFGEYTKADKSNENCHGFCGKTPGTGSCDKDGKCLCWWGNTGPNSKYIKKGKNKGKILADHCEWACTYNADHQSPSCVDEADDGNSSCSEDEDD